MQNEHSQLLIDIQKKSKITIKKVSDLKHLKEDVFTTTGKNISFNTLRRLYGFLPHTTPSQTTLKTLANYLSFSSYSSYLNNNQVYDNWYVYMKILKFQLNQSVLQSHEMDFINTALKNNDNIVSISNYVGFLIREQKQESLHVFFENLNIKSLNNSNSSKFAIICSYAFYRLKKTEIIKLYKELIIHESFRTSIPFYFIDYSNLNGYYLEVLNMIKELKIDASDYLFCCLMEFYKKYYSNDDIDDIEINLPKNNKNIFVVLKGRYYAYKLLKADRVDQKLKNNIKTELKTARTNLLLIEIIPALIIKEEYEYLEKLFDSNYEQIFEVEIWTSSSTVANFLIGLATVNIFKGNFKAAHSNLDLVELDKIELAYTDYISLFYYLTKIKLYYSEGSTEKVNENYNKLELLANKMGFLRFITIAKKYIE